MDSSSSRERDDSIVSKQPLLIEPPKNGFEVESPIFRLPTELILLIFHHFASDFRYRIAISHTCRRWRRIAVTDATLWTNIDIKATHKKKNPGLDRFISLLGMQLDRTADLLLDVEWHTKISDEGFVATLQLIREKAPFSRWRTLDINICGRSHGNALWSSSDAFTNLEVLRGWYEIRDYEDDIIFYLIDRTVTSRLKVLDLIMTTSLRNLMLSFPKSLTHISTLCLDSLLAELNTPFLPNNVINLQVDYGEAHVFPHIRTYKLRFCMFVDSMDLQNMTTLIVTGLLVILPNCQVILPALREFKLATLEMDTGATIEAPLLDHLHFTDYRDGGYCGTGVDRSNPGRAVFHPGYHLSPKTSITIGECFQIRTLIETLATSPKVTHTTLQFDDWADAQVILERLVGLGPVASSQYAENEKLCPKLSELRLNLGWEFSEPSASKEWLLDALRERREAGLTSTLSIYVGWKGEGTFVLFTGS